MVRYIELDQAKIQRMKREAQQFQDDIVCSVGTDFMQKIAEAENRMIFDILKGLEDDPTADVVPKSEVERLESTYSRAIRKADKKAITAIQKAKQEVAREIFEEIDLIHKKVFVDVAKMNLGDLEKAVLHEYFKLIGVCTNALKKKYTEGEVNARG